ncbi:four helix bundle protein [Prolixibacter bellariivorans]
MGTVHRFEDLDIWKESKACSLIIYQHFQNTKDYGFRDQICRAAISVMNNIAEGFERDSDKEFQRFLKIAKGSAGEVRSMLSISVDLNYMSKEEAETIVNRYITLSSRISRFIQYLNSSIKK